MLDGKSGYDILHELDSGSEDWNDRQDSYYGELFSDIVEEGDVGRLNRFLSTDLTGRFRVAAGRNRGLQRAASCGRLNIVKRLLEEPKVLEKVTIDDNGALHTAAGYGHQYIVNRLLKIPAVLAHEVRRDGFEHLVKKVVEKVVTHVSGDNLWHYESTYRNKDARGHLEILSRLLSITPEEVLDAYKKYYYISAIPFSFGRQNNLPTPYRTLASNGELLIQVIRCLLQRSKLRNAIGKTAKERDVENDLFKTLLRIARENNIEVTARLDPTETEELGSFRPTRDTLFSKMIASFNLEEMIQELPQSSSSLLEEETAPPRKIHQRREAPGGVFYSLKSYIFGASSSNDNNVDVDVDVDADIDVAPADDQQRCKRDRPV